MPTLTRWYIKLSLIYLSAALLSGLVLAAQPALHLPGSIAYLSPVYFHLFLVGWVTQLIFGITFWMFPKFSLEKPRGREGLGWSVLILLNIGLLLRVFGEPLNSLQPGRLWGWLLALSALLQWCAGIIFVANTWSRVKEK